MRVVSHHAGRNAPGGGGRQRLCLFFSYCKGWKLAWKPSCVAGDYKTFSFQIWFFPCEFCLLAQRQDASWTAPAEVVLITVLENVLWLGITAAWEEDAALTTVLWGAVFQELPVLAPSRFVLVGECWGPWWSPPWQMVAARHHRAEGEGSSPHFVLSPDIKTWAGVYSPSGAIKLLLWWFWRTNKQTHK